MNVKPIVAAVLLVASAVGPSAAVAAGVTQDSKAYSETYVSFDVQDDAIADYAVNGKTVVDTLRVQSTSEAESSGGIGAGAGLGSVVGFEAAGLSLQASATTSTQAAVRSQSGASIEAHDNERGILVVAADGTSQYVSANVSSDAEARQSGQKRVLVEKESGETGAFLVVGDGEVTVNERGNVSAKLSEDARLIYRQYDGERSNSEEQQEQLITEGTAVAEVYYQSAEEAGSDGGERAADVVRYGQDTSVEVTERSADRVNVTVERAQSRGKVVIVSVSEAAMENAQNARVFVDGEAAAEASSYSEVASATEGGDTSTYLVRSSSSAQASTDVVVGINHFSAREVSVQSGDGDGATGDAGPGFGVVVAIAAIGAALYARTRL